MFKGLANYPVFILTLVSILAISYLSLHVIEKIQNSIAPNNTYEKQVVEYEYVLRNNSLFIKLNKYLEYLYQLSIFTNNTLKIHKLNRLSNLYGPLLLTNDTIRILIVDPFEKTIIDYLVVKDIEKNIVTSIEEYLPPSIGIYIDKPGFVYLESINKTSIFYRLKPLIYTRSISINRDNVYLVSSSDIVINKTSLPLVFLNNSIVEPGNEDQRLNQLVDKYGYVIEYRNYTLNLYSYLNIVLNSRTIYFSKLLTSNPQYYTYTLNLDNIVFNKNVLINTSVFNKINQVVIRDIYGYTYTANITMKFWLVMNSSFRVFLGSFKFNTNDLPSIVLNNYSFINSGVYSSKLLIEYEIYVLQPVLGPAYFTINHVVQGGFGNKVFIKSYLYDKLTVDLGYYSVIYRPIVNNTIVELNITCFLNNSGLFYIFNNQYVSNYFSIQYSGFSRIYVINWIKPNALIITPIYVEIIEASGSKYYLLNESILNKTFGVYIIGDYSDYKLLFNPVMYLDNEYLIYRDNSEVVLLITRNRVILVKNNNYSVYNLVRDIQGFLIVEKIEYSYPLICISDSYGLAINVGIEYLDGSTSAFNLSSSCVFIKNDVLKRVEIIVRNIFSGKYIYSLINESTVFIYNQSKVYSHKYIVDIYVLNNRFKLYLVENSFYILI